MCVCVCCKCVSVCLGGFGRRDDAPKSREKPLGKFYQPQVERPKDRTTEQPNNRHHTQVHGQTLLVGARWQIEKEEKRKRERRECQREWLMGMSRVSRFLVTDVLEKYNLTSRTPLPDFRPECLNGWMAECRVWWFRAFTPDNSPVTTWCIPPPR